MSEKTFRLRAPNGTDEVNSSNERFLVRDGLVDVPSEMIEPMVRVGGFVLIGPTPDPSPVIKPPSAEFVAAVNSALATISHGADIAHPSAALVGEVVAAMEEIAAKPSSTSAAPTIPQLVIPQ